MLQEKFSKGLKLVARLMLVLVLTIITVTIIVTACSVKSSNTDLIGQDTQETISAPTDAVIETIPETVVTEPPKIAEPVLFSDIHYISWYDINKCNEYLDVVFDCVAQIETAMSSGAYTDDAYAEMRTECQRLYYVIAYIESDIRHLGTWESEHFYAAKTWEFLKQQGFSNQVASAIIGNMMIETGGGTLDLNPEIYNPSRDYYGLCQWSTYYFPFMADTSFEEQLSYLVESMPKEFKNFGFCYKSGFTYEDFLAMEDTEQAALAFAKVYERCGSGSYGLRKQAALKAYQYFVCGEYYE